MSGEAIKTKNQTSVNGNSSTTVLDAKHEIQRAADGKQRGQHGDNGQHLVERADGWRGRARGPLAGGGCGGAGRGVGAAPRCATGAAVGARAMDGSGGALGAPVGPPGGSVGNLMVGAAEGFGGKLIRTVSFLG